MANTTWGSFYGHVRLHVPNITRSAQQKPPLPTLRFTDCRQVVCTSDAKPHVLTEICKSKNHSSVHPSSTGGSICCWHFSSRLACYLFGNIGGIVQQYALLLSLPLVCSISCDIFARTEGYSFGPEGNSFGGNCNADEISRIALQEILILPIPVQPPFQPPHRAVDGSRTPPIHQKRRQRNTLYNLPTAASLHPQNTLTVKPLFYLLM